MAAIPAPRDVLRMLRAVGRGSAIDAPRSFLGMVREFFADTPSDSPLTMRELLRRPDYRDLMTAKVAPGDPAFEFELPRLDDPTALPVRLASFRGERPVALVFGSYT